MSEEKKCGGDDLDIHANYVGESWNYQSARLMCIEGRQDARPGTVGTIVSPRQAEGVIIDSGIPDVKTFSFTWRGQLRQFLVKIKSKGGSTSSCTIRLLKPRAGGRWETLSGDVALVGDAVDSNGDPIPLLRNPRALVEWGDVLYFIDYESHRIVILGADELEGMSGNYIPLQTPFSFSGDDELPDNAKGQALIILGDTLYALYLVTDNTITSGHDPGILCRLDIHSNGALTYDTKTTVGLNPQAIIPVSDGADIQLLIPTIGGRQKENGETNGTDSNICCVPAHATTWPAAAPRIITGDATAATPTAYDIHAVAAGTRGRSNMLYILTQMYNDLPAPDDQDDNDPPVVEKALWRLYRITVGDFLNLASDPNAPLTLSEALISGLDDIDEGEVYSDIVPGGIYFWDLLYAQTAEVSDAGDLLWAALGTPVLVTRAAEGGYGAPDSQNENAYLMFGFNGGNNVNAIDMTIEVINQAKRGGLSLKRSLYGNAVSGTRSK
jgi:hypothetical protein